MFFNKKKNSVNAQNSQSEDRIKVDTSTITTMVGVDTVFEGTLRTKSSIRINGTVIGDVRADGVVVLTKTGRIVGTIEAESIIIAGVIEGNMSIRDKVNVEASGEIYGDIITKKFVIDEESIFQGNCIMNRDGKIIPVPPYVKDEEKEEEKEDNNEKKEKKFDKKKKRGKKSNNKSNKNAEDIDEDSKSDESEDKEEDKAASDENADESPEEDAEIKGEEDDEDSDEGTAEDDSDDEEESEDGEESDDDDDDSEDEDESDDVDEDSEDDDESKEESDSEDPHAEDRADDTIIIADINEVEAVEDIPASDGDSDKKNQDKSYIKKSKSLSVEIQGE